ncbi:MAG: PAS domain-containing protein [Planctomycetota bacterium]|nr:PAS domain-containing protein [Planctomycetota bacterium]
MVDDAAIWTRLQGSRVVVLVRLSPDGVIQACNRALCEIVGQDAETLLGRSLTDYLAEHEASSLPLPVEPTDGRRFLLNLVDAHRDPFTFECSVVTSEDQLWLVAEPVPEHELRRQLVDLNNALAVATRESARNARELAAALKDLEQSHWTIRRIQEVLPICLECNRVKGESQWEDVVDFMRRHALFLSHGYCEACANKLRASRGLDRGSRSEGTA